MRRHCIAHVHAVEHPGLELLLSKLEMHAAFFDGEKIASLTGDQVADATRARLVAAGYTVLDMVNDPGREMNGFFKRSLPLLCERTSDGVVFFTHSKGTSHGLNSPSFPFIMRWNETMWRHNVAEYDKWIRPNLGKFGAFGTMRKKREKVVSVWPQEYHYSGTFFWLDLAKLIERDWRMKVDAAWARIDADSNAWLKDHYRRYFSEAFPSLTFPLSESFSVVDIEGNTYSEGFWNQFDKLGV